MIELGEIHDMERLEWVFEINMHSDSRIPLPKDWRAYLPDTSELMLLYDGKKAIGLSSYQAEPPNGAIIHRVIITHWRFRPSRQFYKSHQITQSKKIWLIGKWNHFEIIFDSNTYAEAQKNSQTVVQEFQRKLLRAKGE